MTPRLLLVEDDPKLGRLLATLLGDNGYDVQHVTDVASGKRAAKGDFDIAVIDRMLPDGDGLEVFTALRRVDFDGPVMILTARGETKDRVHGLDFGADDYLTKPFEVDELLARLRALLRRGQRLTSIDAGAIHVDLGRRNAFAHGRLLSLTERELDLLAYLARRDGQLVTRTELVEHVWPASEVVANVIEVHISRLRDKLDADAVLIQTVRGQGYRFDSRAGKP